MIDRLTYAQVLNVAKELRKEASIIEEMSRAREIQDMIDFSDTVEAYAKFLENIVELNKDADEAIKDLTGTK
ncbi:MAG: hypothetical protein J6X28_01115 [Bacilli bacterium]|nr:hypothetical protein [Bacilli bacterium]